MILKRIKNLWKLSAYEPTKIQVQSVNGETLYEPIMTIKKSFPTIAKKAATIIPEETKDIFTQEQEDAEK